MMFDLPTKLQALLARHRIWTTLRGGWPRTPFALSAGEVADLANTVPGICAVRNLPPPRGRGPAIDQLLWPTVATLALVEFGASFAHLALEPPTDHPVQQVCDNASIRRTRPLTR